MSPTTAQQPTYNPTPGRPPLLPTFPPLPSSTTSTVPPMPPATTLAGAVPAPTGVVPPYRNGWMRHALGSSAIPSSTTSGTSMVSPMVSSTPGYSALFGSRSALLTVGTMPTPAPTASPFGMPSSSRPSHPGASSPGAMPTLGMSSGFRSILAKVSHANSAQNTQVRWNVEEQTTHEAPLSQGLGSRGGTATSAIDPSAADALSAVASPAAEENQPFSSATVP